MDNILCWNVRGLSRKQKQLKVRVMISSHKAKLFSYLQTRAKASKMGDLYLNLCPTWCFSTNSSCHNNGRIVIAWDASAFTIDIIHMTSQVIHCSVTPSSTQDSFFCTFFYRLNTTREREALWNTLSELARVCSTSSWITIGDFNAIMELEDRIGSRVRLSEVQPMIQCMAFCQLTTIKTVGRKFTWNNKQDGVDRVFTRIDRVLANSNWGDCFENAEACFLPEEDFDHCPMVLNTHKIDAVKRPFRFYNMWTSSPKFLEIVQTHWCKCKDVFLPAQKQLHSNPTNCEMATAERDSAEQYRAAKENYDSFMHQRAKLHWLEHGDENSKAFHQSIKQRREQNQIYSLQTGDGEWINTVKGFRRLFWTSTAIFSGHPWLTVFIVIQDFFRTGKLHKEINVTSTTLIPKVSVPSSVSDFRPIACCSVVDKCISKLLCAKLNSVLPDIISPNQGAFVAGRSILHNVLVCQDIIKMYRKWQKRANCFMKLDLKNAYDTVEWDFIGEIMTELGFPNHFIQLIMTCLTTTQYSILINGAPTTLIQPKRGLRQGDPLSPLLFTLCMEYFSRAMATVGDHPIFHFHSRCRSLKLNHLCFADDLLMFCKGDKSMIQVMLQGFQLFADTTVLQVNSAKSSLYCCGMNDNAINEIVNLSGFQVGKLPFKYLGVHVSPWKLKTGDCDCLVDKMTHRIKVWSSRNLSFAGRAQLINSVLMRIYVYWSQLFIFS
ncbi:uncharacterized protein [Spinacia oleracea]|uniref:Reverse transcriptase domain-containing protein n=1 Tax=Spinacia oleracea TaxID=3562 RepID=A0A9R0HT97_SPIOL|nr:uncharacterized protein LOC110776392 [Spinacia oleracea]